MIARTLAEFIANLKFEDIPSNVVSEAKKVVLDFLGSALAGSKTEIAKKVINLLSELSGKGTSTVIGHSIKLSMPYAAFANSAEGSYLELDDVLETHPGAIVIPAAISVGECLNASGKEFLTAIIAGYEVQARISKATILQFNRGIDVCATAGTFGSVVAAAKLLDLNPEQICNSIAIAASLAPLSCEEWLYYGSLIKTLEMAYATYTGIMSALFARNGIDGPITIIEGEKGYCKASTYPEPYDVSAIIDRLGLSYEILNTYYKPYASCLWTHAPIEAVLLILKGHSISLDEISKIIVQTHKYASELNFKEPKNELQAKFSIPYTVAIAILYGKVWVDDFTENKLKDPTILDLARKVEVIYDPAVKEGAIVSVLTKNGRKFSMNVRRSSPLTTLQDIEKKFLCLAKSVLDKYVAEQISQTVCNLEKLNDIHRLTKHLST